jgi:hypothetical protein
MIYCSFITSYRTYYKQCFLKADVLDVVYQLMRMYGVCT